MELSESSEVKKPRMSRRAFLKGVGSGIVILSLSPLFGCGPPKKLFAEHLEGFDSNKGKEIYERLDMEFPCREFQGKEINELKRIISKKYGKGDLVNIRGVDYKLFEEEGLIYNSDIFFGDEEEPIDFLLEGRVPFWSRFGFLPLNGENAYFATLEFIFNTPRGNKRAGRVDFIDLDGNGEIDHVYRRIAPKFPREVPKEGRNVVLSASPFVGYERSNFISYYIGKDVEDIKDIFGEGTLGESFKIDSPLGPLTYELFYTSPNSVGYMLSEDGKEKYRKMNPLLNRFIGDFVSSFAYSENETTGNTAYGVLIKEVTRWKGKVYLEPMYILADSDGDGVFDGGEEKTLLEILNKDYKSE